MEIRNSIKSPFILFKIFRDITLAVKLTLLFSLLFAAVSVALFVYLPARFEEQSLRAMNAKASSIIMITSYSAGPAFMFEDTLSFQETIESVRQDSQIVYIMFVGSNGRILSSYQHQAAENENYRAAKTGNRISADGLHLLTYKEVLVQNRPIGELYMGFSLSSLLDEVDRTRVSIAVVSILLFIFGFFSVTWISVIITRPLAHMVATVESITGGDFSKRAAVVSNDELGHLALSFNVMIDRLHSLNTDLEINNQELEARVKLRTADLRREILEHQLAKEALQESEKMLIEAMKIARLGTWEYDVVSDQFRFNDQFYKIFHTTAEREGGYIMSSAHYVQKFVHPDDKDMVGVEIRKSLETTDPAYYAKLDHRIICADGGLGCITVHIRIKKDALGRTIKTHGVNQDITDRKQAEEALQESEFRFRSLYENATIGLYRTTPDGNILMANPALVKMLGYTSFEKLTEINLEKKGFESSSQRKEFLEKIERDGVVHGHDSKWIRHDGKAIFVLESARVIRDSQGKTLYYDGTVEDITEYRQMEEGLRQMQKMEGLGTLAGGIAHDFNNILGIILAYITSTKRYKDDAKKLDLAVDTIVKAVERGKTLVQQILTFARRTETEFGPVDINNVVMEIITMILETFPKILTYSQNLDKDIQLIHADRSQLHQVLLNLCVNARDAMPNGGVLAVKTHMESGTNLRGRYPDAAGNSYVCIEVSDTGEGMAPETQKRIFEPFFTTKEVGKGTGLGLAVVFGVVQTHKGFIDVESSPGKGTTFCLYLPALQAAVPIGVKEEETAEQIPGGIETLLVVEDEEMLMMSLQMALVEKGYNIISAGDGLAAVNIYKERMKEIALVLTDLGLPKMTGMEECKHIKKINPNARMIVATGYLAPGMKSEFLKLGIQHFLYKPYDLTKVLKVVRQALNEK